MCYDQYSHEGTRAVQLLVVLVIIGERFCSVMINRLIDYQTVLK